jgi:hypothetical protein
MKKMILLLFIGLLWSLSSLNATPPKSIAVSYKEGTLHLRIYHDTDNTKNHFIARIIIYYNGILILNNEFQDQSSKKMQELIFRVGLKQGDVVEIKAFCNKKGGRAVKYTVP